VRSVPNSTRLLLSVIQKRKLFLHKFLLLLAFTALLLSACGENGLYHLTWVTEGQHTLTGELPGDLIVLDGEVVIPAGAQVHGKLHQLSGKSDHRR
jgi:hypothetical protein